MDKRARRCLELLLTAAAVLGGGWLLLRFVLPCLAPFLLAFAFASLTEPLVRALQRLRIRRSAAAGFVTLTLLAALLTAALQLVSRGFAALSRVAAALPELIAALEQRLDQAEAWLLALTQDLPGGGAWLEAALDAAERGLSDISAELSRVLLESAAAAAQRGPDLLLFLITAGLGSFFLSAAYPRVLLFLRAQLPERWLRQWELLRQDLRQSLGGWLRAQALLMAITFGELTAALLLMRVRGALLIAALTALVDALPVLGVGAVLLPWAGAALLRSETTLALGLLITWAVTSLVRSCLQAKLLGDQIGLEPLPSLLSAYVGWKLCGVWGALLLPLLAVTLKQLNDRGVLHLWRPG